MRTPAALAPLVLKALALNEARLRLRRTSTLVALLTVVALSWMMIPDPAAGDALLVFDKTRVLYTSSALALGTAALAAILFGLGGFYLVRGRMSEDIRSGAGGVIGASAVPGGLFLAGRWLGGVAYLSALTLTFMLSVLALHALRGEGPVELSVYLATYTVMLLPMLCFAVSCAILFDSWAPLMGKGGDVLFFFLWIAQFVLMTNVDKPGASPYQVLLDFSGLGVAVFAVKAQFATDNFSIGSSPFDATLAPLVLPSMLWTGQMLLVRLLSLLIALLPLLPAIWLFHRFSPDKVKVSRAHARRSPLALVNSALRPVSVLVRPLFALAGRLPGIAGQVTGDVALTLLMAPAAVPALLGAAIGGALVPGAALPAVLIGAVATWGILISEVSTRDFASATEDLSGAVPGGVAQRYLRQYLATLVLGLLFCGVVALRWSLLEPALALALLVGVAALSGLASLFGRYARSPRLFVALFLFALYVATNVRDVAMLDAVGFNGVADARSMAMYAAIALASLGVGYWWNRRA